ncbi:hypothetical protein GCM10010246_35040 [Streptomyces cuspidosporus]|uniref:Uncharacterized protein n=1 Tax=Streptomyces cuspidosporus TaxID=66882 RepID=A0ABP5T7M7_9ACTN
MAKLPVTAPCTANTTATATRALRTSFRCPISRASAVPSMSAAHPPGDTIRHGNYQEGSLIDRVRRSGASGPKERRLVKGSRP